MPRPKGVDCKPRHRREARRVNECASESNRTIGLSLLILKPVTGCAIELLDLPFASGRSFRLRVNGKWARRMPVGSKTKVLQQLRRWWVIH